MEIQGFLKNLYFFCMDILEYVCVCILTGYSDWNSYLILLKAQGHKEKAMAPHSSTLAWKIPWVEESGRLKSMGSLPVGHD